MRSPSADAHIQTTNNMVSPRPPSSSLNDAADIAIAIHVAIMDPQQSEGKPYKAPSPIRTGTKCIAFDAVAAAAAAV